MQSEQASSNITPFSSFQQLDTGNQADTWLFSSHASDRDPFHTAGRFSVGKVPTGANHLVALPYQHIGGQTPGPNLIKPALRLVSARQTRPCIAGCSMVRPSCWRWAGEPVNSDH